MLTFTRLTLTRQFMLFSLVVLLAGMIVVGIWVGEQIQQGVMHRSATISSLYVLSFISPHLHGVEAYPHLHADDREALDRLLTETPLGQQIVSFKVWSQDGEVLYSSNPDLIGRHFPVGDNLVQAFEGDVSSGLSDLSALENWYESQTWDALIETYAPVSVGEGGDVVAVAEFYQTPDALFADLRAARLRSWLVVGAATLAMYLLLAGLVGRASNMILSQRAELESSLNRLRETLAQNELLHARVRRAAAKQTDLNEHFLHRISADLHDGPGQAMALALLRLGALSDVCRNCPATDYSESVTEDFDTVQSALSSALADLRTIAAGLQLPEVGSLTLAETAQHVVRAFERLSSRTVGLSLADLPADSPLPVKITLYRLLQEALANGYKHANGLGQEVRVAATADELLVEVLDHGPGFDAQTKPEEDTLGLAGMRERVEVLGGHFEIKSTLGQGTTIRARLPLAIPEVEDV